MNESGAASIKLELSNGNIHVIHSESGHELAVLKNAPPGSWDRIWGLFEEMGFERG